MIEHINSNMPTLLNERYGIDTCNTKYEVLQAIASARHCLIKGGELDTNKAAMILIDDFRSGKLGRITLETPEEY